MKLLTEDIIHFFKKQGAVIVSTVDASGRPHSSCKDIVHMDPEGDIYLLDLYKGRTRANLTVNPNICITAVDEHKFKGFCIEGAANLVPASEIKSRIIKAWDERVTSRVTKRVLRELREDGGHPSYPELSMPKPEYMIVMKVENVVDLAPHAVK
jgi:general stress protein 26